MRSNRTISLLMALLVLGASFMTLCPASETKSSDVHFIAETCENHDCSRSNESQSRTEENCQHQICPDQSFISDFVPNHTIQPDVVAPPPLAIVDIFFSSKIQNISLQSLLDPPLPSTHRSAILRI